MLGLEILHRSLLHLKPETAHDRAIEALRLAQSLEAPLAWLRKELAFRDPRLEQTIWNTRFANPVGLAAGYDKNGEAVHALAALGFKKQAKSSRKSSTPLSIEL